MELRDYQVEIVQRGLRLLTLLRIVYLSLEVRVGKTLTALTIADRFGAKCVLFITKKKAIGSIYSDFEKTGLKYNLLVINYEGLGMFFHEGSLELKVVNSDLYEDLRNLPKKFDEKVLGKELTATIKTYIMNFISFLLTIVAGNTEWKTKPYNPFDLVIIDEAHSLGAFPKPSLQTQRIKRLVGDKPLILMSGTPSPESFSQLYHQFYVSDYSPFKNPNFYKFAKEFVDVKERIINGYPVRDYSKANAQLIKKFTDAYFISFTQKEAGFESEIVEEIKHVQMNDSVYRLAEILIRERYYKMKNGSEIVCDTAAKLKSKLHQIFSGTVKCETGQRYIIDTSKADYIRENYHGKKLAIFYKFIAEGDALKAVFPEWTDSPEEFNSNLFSKNFICQIQSGSMGTNLSSADTIIFYNIDFSSLLYFQARSRMMTKDRVLECPVHWIFSQDGIEDKIYKRVIKKRDYTTTYFQKDFLCLNKNFKQSA